MPRVNRPDGIHGSQFNTPLTSFDVCWSISAFLDSDHRMPHVVDASDIICWIPQSTVPEKAAIPAFVLQTGHHSKKFSCNKSLELFGKLNLSIEPPVEDDVNEVVIKC